MCPPRKDTKRPPKVPPMIWSTWGTRLREECIQRYLDSLEKHLPWEPFAPGEPPAGTLVLRDGHPVSDIPGSGPAIPGMLLHPAITERAPVYVSCQ
eukprot:11750086-Alexandrium_andersonii.AAC.1